MKIKKHNKVLIIVLIIISLMVLGLFSLTKRYLKNNNEFRDELNKSEILKDEIGEILFVISNSNYNKEKEDYIENTLFIITKKLRFIKLTVDYMYKENAPCYVVNKKRLCEVNENFKTEDYLEYIENNEYNFKIYQKVTRYDVEETASNLLNIAFSFEKIDYNDIETFNKLKDIKTYYDAEQECWLVKGIYKNELYNVIISNKEYRVLAIWKENIN